MPVAPRSNKKATAIFFSLVGVPAPMRSKKTKKQKKIDAMINHQKTDRVK